MLVNHRAQKTPTRLSMVPIINDQTFGNLEMTFPPDFLVPPQIGTPHTLAPTHLTNTQSFGALTIGPPPGIVDALLIAGTSTYLKINNSDYLRIQE
jgi:hypothetical protein